MNLIGRIQSLKPAPHLLVPGLEHVVRRRLPPLVLGVRHGPPLQELLGDAVVAEEAGVVQGGAPGRVAGVQTAGGAAKNKTIYGNFQVMMSLLQLVRTEKLLEQGLERA